MVKDDRGHAHCIIGVTKVAFVVAPFIVVNVNEFTTIDNTMVVNPFVCGAKMEAHSHPFMC